MSWCLFKGQARLGFLMGSRFGHAVYSRQSIAEHLVEECVVAQVGQPIIPLLRRVLERQEKFFYDDVVLVSPSNALKFTERGGGDVRVELRTAGAGEGSVTFEIRDTGIGMSPTVQKAIFQPFAQGDGSTTRKYGGTGLGLAIVRNLSR